MDAAHIFGAKHIGQISRNGRKSTAIEGENDHGRGIEVHQPDHPRIRTDLSRGPRNRHVEADADHKEDPVGPFAPQIVG